MRNILGIFFSVLNDFCGIFKGTFQLGWISSGSLGYPFSLGGFWRDLLVIFEESFSYFWNDSFQDFLGLLMNINKGLNHFEAEMGFNNDLTETGCCLVAILLKSDLKNGQPSP